MRINGANGFVQKVETRNSIAYDIIEIIDARRSVYCSEIYEVCAILGMKKQQI